jgi:hypothetical protein
MARVTYYVLYDLLLHVCLLKTSCIISTETNTLVYDFNVLRSPQLVG